MRTRALFFSALILSAAGAIAAPKRITTYDQLVRDLDAGKTVKIVANYAKTKLIIDGKEEKAPDATGGAVIDAWERFEKGLLGPKAFISTSHTVLISHPRYRYVYNYVKFRFFDDGAVEITARYLTTDKFDAVMDEKFMGKISNGKDKEGVHLYSE